ncbi:MAG: hypothetical protein ABI690_02745 [Chloroflexota bacterium]
MPFVWQFPYEPPDAAALDRMRQNFPMPSEIMPYAWFMTGVDLMTWLAESASENFSAKQLTNAIHEIWTGIAFFPNAYPEVWGEWLRYLLPYAIKVMNSIDDDSWNPLLFPTTFKAIYKVFPEQIADEYSGFRDDLVYTFGTRIFPQVLSRDNPATRAPESASLQNPVFNDIWDYTNSPGMENPGNYDVFYFAMYFCLVYLNAAEIESWVESMLKIESPQWRLSILTRWLALVRGEDDDNDFKVSPPPANMAAFYEAMKRHLSHERFRTWVADIKSHQTFKTQDHYIFPISDALRTSIEQSLVDFETKFFSVE